MDKGTRQNAATITIRVLTRLSEHFSKLIGQFRLRDAASRHRLDDAASPIAQAA